MPVTLRKLLIAKVSGAGKKAPTNLRFDPSIGKVINIDCYCKPVAPVCCDVKFDAGIASSNFTDVVYDDGTGIAVDAGNASTQACS